MTLKGAQNGFSGPEAARGTGDGVPQLRLFGSVRSLRWLLLATDQGAGRTRISESNWPSQLHSVDMRTTIYYSSSSSRTPENLDPDSSADVTLPPQHRSSAFIQLSRAKPHRLLSSHTQHRYCSPPRTKRFLERQATRPRNTRN